MNGKVPRVLRGSRRSGPNRLEIVESQLEHRQGLALDRALVRPATDEVRHRRLPGSAPLGEPLHTALTADEIDVECGAASVPGGPGLLCEQELVGCELVGHRAFGDYSGALDAPAAHGRVLSGARSTAAHGAQREQCERYESCGELAHDIRCDLHRLLSFA